MESGEHMPDKNKFMRELVRVTAPGGRVLVVTWCHRELKEGEKSLTVPELRLLEKINKGMRVACLPFYSSVLTRRAFSYTRRTYEWCYYADHHSAYYLPDWVPGSHYAELARSLGLRDVKTADWSAHVVNTRLPFSSFLILSSKKPCSY